MKDLKQAAEKWISENAHSCDFIGEAVAERAFLAGAKWQQRQSTWTSVNDSLPDEWERVLVAYSDGTVMLTCRIDVLGGGVHWDRMINEDSIVAWMPLPEYKKADSK